MKNNKYQVDVLVNGRPVKEYVNNGHTYIEGKGGSNYQIRIKNNSFKRVKAVVTVDSQNVISDNGNYVGYIISPYQSITIKGFRTSDQTEAAFEFCEKQQSRAKAAKNTVKNCGVIGVLIYEELAPSQPLMRPHLPYKYTFGIPYCSDNTSNIAPSVLRNKSGIGGQSVNATYGMHVNNVNCSVNEQTTPNFTLGTSMGHDVQSPVEYTDFFTGPLQATFKIYYSSRNQLKKAGILENNIPKISSMPEPFDFCKRY